MHKSQADDGVDGPKDFINVDGSVGERKADANIAYDCLVVQRLLWIVYEFHPSYRAIKPIKGTVQVKYDLVRPDTRLLISHFQRVALKRPRPEGYINKATRTDRQLEFSTIYVLNRTADAATRGAPSPLSGMSAIDVVKALHPELKGILDS